MPHPLTPSVPDLDRSLTAAAHRAGRDLAARADALRHNARVWAGLGDMPRMHEYLALAETLDAEARA